MSRTPKFDSLLEDLQSANENEDRFFAQSVLLTREIGNLLEHIRLLTDTKLYPKRMKPSPDRTQGHIDYIQERRSPDFNKKVIEGTKKILSGILDWDRCNDNCKSMYFCEKKKGHKGSHLYGGLAWSNRCQAERPRKTSGFGQSDCTKAKGHKGPHRDYYNYGQKAYWSSKRK